MASAPHIVIAGSYDIAWDYIYWTCSREKSLDPSNFRYIAHERDLLGLSRFIVHRAGQWQESFAVKHQHYRAVLSDPSKNVLEHHFQVVSSRAVGNRVMRVPIDDWSALKKSYLPPFRDPPKEEGNAMKLARELAAKQLREAEDREMFATLGYRTSTPYSALQKAMQAQHRKRTGKRVRKGKKKRKPTATYKEYADHLKDMAIQAYAVPASLLNPPSPASSPLASWAKGPQVLGTLKAPPNPHHVGDAYTTPEGQMLVCVSAGSPGEWVTPSTKNRLSSNGFT